MEEWVFHEDPGHGWLEVPVAHLRLVGVAAEISGYSYRRGDRAYLEEDIDLSTFVRAWEKARCGFDWEEVRRIRHNDEAPLRRFDHYTGG